MSRASSSNEYSKIHTSTGSGFRARVLEGHVKDTKTLVDALNCSNSWIKEKGVLVWLRSCIEWFTTHSSASLTSADVKEYAALGNLTAQCVESKALLRNWFDSICEKVQDRYGEQQVVDCIDKALECVDPEIFEGNATCLMNLANDLFEKLDVRGITLTRESYPTHGITLFALQQTFVVMREVAPRQLDPKVEGGLYQKFKTRLEEIVDAQHYYPFRHQARLIRQALKMCEREEATVQLKDVSRRFFFGTYAILCLLEGVRSISVLEINHGAFEAAMKNLKLVTKSSLISKKKLRVSLFEMREASLKCMQESITFEQFEDTLREKMRRASSTWRAKHQTALRFCIVNQLHLLALHGPTFDIRSRTLDTLLRLANESDGRGSVWSGWANSAEAFEGILDALYFIYPAVGAERQSQIRLALERMTAITMRDAREKVNEWLGPNETLMRKLTTAARPPIGSVAICPLAKLGHDLVDTLQCRPTAKEIHYMLRTNYQEGSFAAIRSIFDGAATKHIKEFHFHLLLVQSNESEIDDRPEMTQTEEHLERRSLNKVSIAYKELFRWENKSFERFRQTRVVAVVGDPGTGKTTLSRRLSYSWSLEEWGTKFMAVYLLPVRYLKKEDYDGLGTRRQRTLATAIVNLCFPHITENATFECIRAQVSEDLMSASTLVILDGLDEDAGACEGLLREAKSLHTSLLMLSRPYGMRPEDRDLAEVEIECAGLNDDQLHAFFSNSLSPKKMILLESYLISTAAVWEVAHVPVNAHILCFLWNSSTGLEMLSEGSGSLLHLYRTMTHFVWDRFARKYGPRMKRDDVFQKLRIIAYTSLVKGDIFINQSVISEHIDDLCVQDVVKRSAFLLLEFAGCEYQFPHLTFQEYFCGCFQAQKFSSKDHEFISFLKENKYNPGFRVTIMFLMEEIASFGDHENMIRLFSLLDDSGIDMLGFQHVLLKFRTIESFLASTKHKSGKRNNQIVRIAEPIVRAACRFLRIVCENAPGILPRHFLTELTNVVTQFRNYLSFLPNGPNQTTESQFVKQNLEINDTHSFVRDHTINEETQNLSDTKEVKEKSAQTGTGIDEENKQSARTPMSKMHVKGEGSSRERQTSTERGEPNEEEKPGIATHMQEQRTEHEDVSKWLFELGDEFVDVRSAAVEQSVQMIRARPEIADEIAAKWLRALSSDEHWHVRSTAVGQSVKMMGARSEIADEIATTWLRALSDQHWHVRSTAVGQSVQMMGARPESADEIATTWLRALRDPDGDVRSTAVAQVLQMLDARPESADEITAKWLHALSDAYGDVRSAAVTQSVQMLRARPESADEITATWLHALSDAYGDVRSAAVTQSVQMLRARPESADEITAKWLRALGDAYGDVRSVAVTQSVQMLRARPESADEIGAKWLCALSDADCNVRRAAVAQSFQMLGARPENGDDIVSSLADLMGDAAVSVRRVAGREIIDIISENPEVSVIIPEAVKALFTGETTDRVASLKLVPSVIASHPHASKDLCLFISNACNDHDPNVRQAAAPVVSSLLSQGVGDADILVDVVGKLSADSLSEAQKTLVRSFDQWPLLRLLEMHWSVRSNGLLKLIVRAMFHVAVTVEGDQSDSQWLLVLHTNRSPVLSKPRLEVMQFLSDIRAQIDNEFPELRDALGSH